MTASVPLHPVVDAVTRRVVARSATTRSAYLERIRAAAAAGPATGPGRADLGCANLAHAVAACGPDKLTLTASPARNIGIGSDTGVLVWREGPTESLDKSVLRSVADPFSPDGGLRVLHGNLGRSVVKTSAVEPDHRVVEAPAVVFDDQDDLLAAFAAGELDGRDLVAVVRYQGPRANGMPELHKLTPALGLLQDRGHQVAIVTDGRMSGASGKVPAALHVTPEAAQGGPLRSVRDGDLVRLDTLNGTLSLLVDADEFDARARPTHPPLRSDDRHRARAVRRVPGGSRTRRRRRDRRPALLRGPRP